MGKNKLKKFADMKEIDFVFQYPFAVLKENGFPLKGKWHSELFKNDNPIILELGCGKGEYTVGLARRFPDCNYIGVDIKGARMWTGATQARNEGLSNVAFLRTDIELIDHFFTPGEVDEIWITFPDPQMKKVRKRLTGTRFLQLYRNILRPDGVINLKTDSPFLYTYTSIMVDHNKLPLEVNTADLYNGDGTVTGPILDIKTFYEQQWLDRGLSIKYLRWRLTASGELTEPEVDIEPDTYRSFSRGQIQCPEKMTPKVTPKQPK